MLLTNQGSLLRLFACFLVLGSAAIGSAESFAVHPLSSDQGWNLIGIEGNGGVVILNGYTSEYQTFLDGTLVSQSPTPPAPTLFDDGAACAPAMPAGFVIAAARCNSSFQAIDGFDYASNPNQHTPRLYSGPDLADDLVTIGGGGLLFLNSTGTLTWDDAFSDTIFEATPQALTATPEPSTLALLATGTLTLIATLRRRRNSA